MKYVESLNRGLQRLLSRDERVVLLGEDLVDPYGGAFKVTRGLSSEFPGRVIPAPISEAAITGAAAGMAMRGLRPVAEIMFGDFLPLCMDQLVNHAAKFSWIYNGQVKVPMVLRAPMGGYRGYGPTHSQTLESLLGSVPGIEIVAPSHYHDPGQLLESALLEAEGPVLFVESKLLYPRRLVPLGQPEPVTSLTARPVEGADPSRPTLSARMVADEEPELTVIAYGGMAALAAEAVSEIFMEDEIVAELLVPSSVKPLPAAGIIRSVRTSGRAVVVEEGCRTGGWGAEVAARIQEDAFDALRAPVLRVAAEDSSLPAAPHLERGVLPSAEGIGAALRRCLEAS